MEDKITIIEGPPPEFEQVNDGWALGLNESPWLYDLHLTQVRTFNGPALVERCHHAWEHGGPIYLHYRNDLGLEESAPIMAARSLETEDGQLLLLWIRMEPNFSELDDDDEDEDDEDLDDELDEGDLQI